MKSLPPNSDGFEASGGREPPPTLFKLQKLILEILLARQKRPLFPIFHFSYTAHWKASSASVMVWHIYERCTGDMLKLSLLKVTLRYMLIH